MLWWPVGAHGARYDRSRRGQPEITPAPELVAEILGIVRELAADGMAILMATHEMGFARDVSSSKAAPSSCWPSGLR